MSSAYIEDTKDPILVKINTKMKPIEIPRKNWVQFVPGIVHSVVVNTDSPGYDSPQDLNTILAKSHAGSDVNYKTPTAKYKPLFRGMVDVPVKGDPVLLCSFPPLGNFYLGPLNSDNSPNFNVDRAFFDKSKYETYTKQSIIHNKRDFIGLSHGYKVNSQNRLFKDFKEDLDNVGNDAAITSQPLGAVQDIHGDMVFEGRHGNSIRIGSRSDDPYIFMSNNRVSTNREESFADGSLFAMIGRGTLDSHFPKFYDIGTTQEKTFSFTLASDDFNGNTSDRVIGDWMYGYKWPWNQSVLSSDRITFNSSRDSIFLSSFLSVIIGAGDSFVVKANKEIVLDGYNIYLGKPYNEVEMYEMEPLVLGNQLLGIMTELTDVLSKAAALFNGSPIPLVDIENKPLAPNFIELKQKLQNFLSKYHYIEKNTYSREKDGEKVKEQKVVGREGVTSIHRPKAKEDEEVPIIT